MCGFHALRGASVRLRWVRRVAWICDPDDFSKVYCYLRLVQDLDRKICTNDKSPIRRQCNAAREGRTNRGSNAARNSQTLGLSKSICSPSSRDATLLNALSAPSYSDPLPTSAWSLSGNVSAGFGYGTSFHISRGRRGRLTWATAEITAGRARRLDAWEGWLRLVLCRDAQRRNLAVEALAGELLAPGSLFAFLAGHHVHVQPSDKLGTSSTNAPPPGRSSHKPTHQKRRNPR